MNPNHLSKCLISKCLRPAILAALLTCLHLGPAVAASDPAKGEGDDPGYLSFDAFSVTVIAEGRIQGQVAVKMGLTVPELENRQGVEKMRPKLRDAFLQTLNHIASTRLDADRPVNPALIDRYLQRVADRILGDHVADVIIETATIRPL